LQKQKYRYIPGRKPDPVYPFSPFFRGCLKNPVRTSSLFFKGRAVKFFGFSQKNPLLRGQGGVKIPGSDTPLYPSQKGNKRN